MITKDRLHDIIFILGMAVFISAMISLRLNCSEHNHEHSNFEGLVPLDSFPENKLGISYKNAIANSEKIGKPILIEFYADWCLICKEIEQTIFKDSDVIKELSDNFYFLHYNVRTDEEEEIFCEGKVRHLHDCIHIWKIDGVPVFAVLDKYGNLNHITEGTADKAAFLDYLKSITGISQD